MMALGIKVVETQGRRIARMSRLGPIGAACIAVLAGIERASAEPPAEAPIGLIAPGDGALRFGEAVAADGAVVAIGSPTAGDTGNLPGEVRVFRTGAGPLGGLSIAECARFVAWRAGDHFGASLAIRVHPGGVLLAVGADGANAVEIYRADPDARNWRHEATIEPLHPDPGAEFGHSVAIAPDGRTVVVGARRSDSAGLLDAGAAYLFAYDDALGAWKERARIESPGPRMSGWFGSAVAISADAVVVGAPGEAVGGIHAAGAAHLYAFVPDGPPRFSGSLASPDPLGSSWFGAAVVHDGSRVVIGEPRARRDGARCGAAWVWSATAPLIGPTRVEPARGSDGDGFGQAVALFGDLLVVGAPGAQAASLGGVMEDSGAVTAFDLSGLSPARLLTMPGARASSFLGASVAAVHRPDGNFVLAGHLYVEEESAGPSPGVAVFRLTPWAVPASERDPPDTSAQASASSPPPSRRR